MSRSTNQGFVDRLRLALASLMGRPPKPTAAYATVPVRRLPRRTTDLGR